LRYHPLHRPTSSLNATQSRPIAYRDNLVTPTSALVHPLPTDAPQFESEHDMVLTGGCQCGAVRYEIDAKPLDVYICHCRECRKQSASAFGISVIVPAKAFVLKQGRVKTWSRPTDSGGVLDCTFCEVCGSRIAHTDGREETISVKGGSLDEPPDLTSASHIWTQRKLPGVVIPDGTVQWPGEPD
jgi:hypothetical protein